MKTEPRIFKEPGLRHQLGATNQVDAHDRKPVVASEAIYMDLDRGQLLSLRTVMQGPIDQANELGKEW